MFKFQKIKNLGGTAIGRCREFKNFSTGSFGSSLGSSAPDLNFFDPSFRKIVGAEVDTRSDDYLRNYEQMIELN